MSIGDLKEVVQNSIETVSNMAFTDRFFFRSESANFFALTFIYETIIHYDGRC